MLTKAQELGNICGASEDAIALCETAQATLEAEGGTRDQADADIFNNALGL